MNGDLTAIIWDSDDDPEGNVQHIARHNLTKQDVEEVLENPIDMDTSSSSGSPVAFGDTPGGRHIMVVYEIDGTNAYPITAYDVPRRKQ